MRDRRLAATSDDIRKRAFRIMDSGYLDGRGRLRRIEQHRTGEGEESTKEGGGGRGVHNCARHEIAASC